MSDREDRDADALDVQRLHNHGDGYDANGQPIEDEEEEDDD